MSQAAPGGQYVLQQQTLGNQQQGGAQGPQIVQIAPATAEVHYGYSNIGDGTGNSSTPNIGPYQLDGQTSNTLANRVSMEFYNNGANDIEISTNSSFQFGVQQGRTIKPGSSWTITVMPANVSGGVKHYALCGSGNVCKLEIAEAGQ